MGCVRLAAMYTLPVIATKRDSNKLSQPPDSILEPRSMKARLLARLEKETAGPS
jgi:hypothetical protein